jgi:S-formylglutathione hydrolase FrmB
VVVDCFTKLGGNQYINSSATGNYEDFIIQEVVPFIKNEYNTSSLIVMGKSSGGYGAFSLAGNNHTIFQGLVSHSGDCGFEYCYFPDFPIAIETLRSSRGVKNWIKTFWSNAHHDRSKSSQMKTLNIVAMSAHYSPNTMSENGFDLPFNYHTGEIIDKVWKVWQSKDPVRLVDSLKSKLRHLKYVYIDCGVYDEFNLQLGNRALHYKLKKLGIKHYYEEFDGGHFNTSFRFDKSLEIMSKIFK